MKIWIKINDCYGFTGLSYGETIGDIDNDIPDNVIENLFGTSWEKVYYKFRKLNDANYLTEELTEYMNSIGWFENSDYWKSNGDVHAYCFEQMNKNK